MLRQYQSIKDQYPDALLFFRIGDFFELFNEDARIAARVLDLTLTRKAAGKGTYIPLAGVPHHAAEQYIARLIRRGFRVAVCDQVEDPKAAKGIVKREVVRVVTPGTVTEPGQLSDKDNNFLAALWRAPDGEGAIGWAAADLSTGELWAAVLADPRDLQTELARFRPAELIVAEEDAGLRELAGDAAGALWTPRAGWQFAPAEARQVLREHFGVRETGGIVSDTPELIAALGALLAYLRETQQAAARHLTRVREYRAGDGMALDEATIRNLELVRSATDAGRTGSLLWALDSTVTAAGARLLQHWLLRPLTDPAAITVRLDRVAALHTDTLRREAVRTLLRDTSDLQRLGSRLCLRRIGPRDLLGIAATLRLVPGLKAELAALPALAPLAAQLDPCPEVRTLIEGAIAENAPATLKDGGVMAPGYSAELDELRTAARGGKEWIAALQEQERQRSGISSLKIGFNRVFGYYIEITNANRASVPADYERKQTLANAERYITPALKEKEAFVLHAEERMLALEEQLFAAVREEAAQQVVRLQDLAALLAELDVLAAFAENAANRRYVRPQVDDGGTIAIREGRHPVIEQLVEEEPFVPNDLALGGEAQLLVITGPNMAGKSTFIRQAALLVLMAQCGSFVPAAEARIGAVDRIFTRVGAADQLARGRSTFMVEMLETALILNRATERSLLVLDEIGRGTSTFDGLAIAWAVAEHIAGSGGIGAKTLFATHYHELTELARVLSNVRNYNVAVREWNDEIIFLRRIVEGGADRSYGIQVARLAGLPPAVIGRAKEILFKLEQGELNANRPRLAGGTKEPEQLSLFEPAVSPVVHELVELNVDGLTPLAALNLLAELKRKAVRETEGTG